MTTSCIGKSQISCQEEFLHGKNSQALEQAAQEGGEVTVPGGVQESCGCVTEGRGQWAQWELADNWTR